MGVGIGELGVIAIVFGSIVAVPVGIVVVICGTILVLSRRGKRSRQMEAEESRMIQEVYQGLHGFEKRIDALEGLLLERDHSRKEGTRS